MELVRGAEHPLPDRVQAAGPRIPLVFLSCVVLGSVWEGEAVWELVDLCNALMAIPNLTALLLLSPQVLRELRDWERTGG